MPDGAHAFGLWPEDRRPKGFLDPAGLIGQTVPDMGPLHGLEDRPV
jgi:hypothetical protein